MQTFQDTMDDTKKIIEKLKKLGIKENNIQVSFSGNKGFHVVVDGRVFGLKPSPDLHKQVEFVHNYMRKELKLKTLCGATGNRKMLRVQNTINKKSGLYKITIPIEMINGDMDDIVELAKKPKKKEKNDAPVFSQIAHDWFYNILKDYKEVRYTPNKKLNLPKEMPPCIKDLTDNSIQVEGSRNKATMLLASYYKDMGLTEDTTCDIINEWNKKIPDKLTSTKNGQRHLSSQSAVKTIFNSGQYHFSCKFSRSMPWRLECDKSCKLFKEKK